MSCLAVESMPWRRVSVFPEWHPECHDHKAGDTAAMEEKAQQEDDMTTDAPDPGFALGRSVDLRRDGLLWLINRQVFWPRGYALGCDLETGEFFLLGDGSEPYVMGGDGSEERPMLERVRKVMP